jgi:hypothetical protein
MRNVVKILIKIKNKNMDLDLEKNLKEINQNLVEIKKKKGPGILRAFFNGVFGALGYLVGLAIIFVVLGWFLNKIGMLSVVKDQLSNFQTIIDQAKKITAPEKGSEQKIIIDGHEVQLK